MENEKLLKALELDKAGNWEEAHRISQEMDSTEAHWLHAYLHRKEGDLGNAGYWYTRAGKPIPKDSLEDEWQRLHQAFGG